MKKKSLQARRIANQHRIVRSIFSKHYLAWAAGMNKPVYCLDHDMNLRPQDSHFQHTVSEVPIKWNIECCILFKEKNGKRKLKSLNVVAPYPCKHGAILESVTAVHMDFLHELPPMERECVLTLAWVASGSSKVPTEEQMYEYFNKLGVWDELLTPWELELQNNETN